MGRDTKASAKTSLWGRMSHRFSSQPEPDDERPVSQVFPIPGEGTTLAGIPDEPGLAPPPAPQGNHKGARVDDSSYSIEFENQTLWPCFTPTEGSETWMTHQILTDRGDRVRQDWSLGRAIGNQFGGRMFPSRTQPTNTHNGAGRRRRSLLPPLLFDLQENRVVRSSDLPDPDEAEYIVVSHVWGDDILELPGIEYGVSWNIPIQSARKLQQILTACRAVGGVRFMWMDVLCLDQRGSEDRAEMVRMKIYWEEAAGCLVWLDNTHWEPDWDLVLHSITEVNRVYGMDRHGAAHHGPPRSNIPPPSVPQSALRCFRMLRNLTALERAPWFRRVWTLQEGILPQHVLFVTPERYLLDRGCIFQLLEAFGRVAQHTLDQGIRWGVGLLQELQRSEMWKMLKIKQLHAAQKLSYAHVAHALRTRQCHRDVDRLLGVWGLVQSHLPSEALSHANSVRELYQAYYQMSVESGDLSLLFFLGGGSIWNTGQRIAFWLGVESAPVSTPATAEGIFSHTLSFTTTGHGALPQQLTLEDVAYDTVTAVHCLSAKGSLRAWGRQFGIFHDHLESERQRVVDITRASGLPTSSALLGDGRLGPGYLAAILPWKTGSERQLKQYDAAFLRDLRCMAVQTVVLALQCRWLEAQLDDSAVVVIWTKTNQAQLAVVTEPLNQLLRGQTVIVMPRSYSNVPGRGCLLCLQEESGTTRKVGLGLGNKLRAEQTGTFVIS